TFWLRHFGGDPHAIGQRLRIETEWFEIIGIAPPGFRALNLAVEPDVTLPLTAFPIITRRAANGFDEQSVVLGAHHRTAQAWRDHRTSARGCQRVSKIVESEVLHECDVEDACPRLPDVGQRLRVG